jgi:hypothetical protein
MHTNYSYSIVLKKVKFQVKSHQVMQHNAVFFSLLTMILFLIPLQSVLAQTSEDEMMMQTMTDATHSDSPLMQMAMGVDLHELQCKDGQQLVFKASNWRPACVNESSVTILQERGWATASQPSDDDLMKMKDEYMVMHPVTPQEQTGQDNGGVEINEGMTIDETANTNGNQTESQNFTVNLSESMEMGAQ